MTLNERIAQKGAATEREYSPVTDITRRADGLGYALLQNARHTEAEAVWIACARALEDLGRPRMAETYRDSARIAALLARTRDGLGQVIARVAMAE